MRWVLVLLAACHAADPTPTPALVAPAPSRPVVHRTVTPEPPKLPAPPVPAPPPILTSEGAPASVIGQVIDRRTGEPAANAIIAVRVGDTSQLAVTDEDGYYAVAMPPGHALVTFYYGDEAVTASADIGDDVVAVDVAVGEPGDGRDDNAVSPTIDPEASDDTITIDKNYIENIPVPGRTFEAVLGAAAGAQVDGYGVSFSSNCGLENQYIVE